MSGKSFRLILMLLVAVLTLGWPVSADETGPTENAEPPADAAADAAEPTPAEGAEPAADEVLKQMLEKRRSKPVIEPVDEPAPTGDLNASPTRGSSIDIDERVVGIAPGQPQPILRREGEFIPLRRGRLMRSPSGNQFLFVFEADDRQTPEDAMFLLPCKHLESMEQYILERGDKVVFNVSGQIFTYRGANYLLPTKWNIPPDRGNLQN